MVELTEPKRCDDPAFQELQQKLRTSICGVSDYKLLCSRVVGQPGVDINTPKFADAPIIVARHDVRQRLVMLGMEEFQRKNHSAVLIFPALDKFSKSRVPAVIKGLVEKVPGQTSI